MGSNNAPVPVANVPEAQSPPSDNDNNAGERPVRKQLKETSIDSDITTAHETGSSRKRSLEESREVDNENGEKPRKRSRESTPEKSNSTQTSTGNAADAGIGPEAVSVTYFFKPLLALQEKAIERVGPVLAVKSFCLKLAEKLAVGQIREIASCLSAFADKKELKETKGPKLGQESLIEILKSSAKIWHSHSEKLPSNRLTKTNPQDKTSTNDTATNDKGLTKKRSHERLEDDHGNPATASASTKDTVLTDSNDINPTADGEREKKRHRDNSQERETMANNGFASSAFGKAIGASPFTSLNKSKDSTGSTNKPASTSAFASSSMAAFAGSESSPFGTLGASTSVFNKSPANATSGFGSTPTSSGFGTNAFAAAASKPSGLSGFASTPKASGLTSFASTPKTGGLTSFASSDAAPTLGETKPKPLGVKPFGQPSNSDDDDESGDDDEDENGSTFEAAKTDERFYEQTIATGEESEKNVFTCKAKLFHFSEKEWKERGIGTFKINVRNVDGKETGRMIMRADGAGRVMLNSPIFKGMSYGDANNQPPSSKQIMLVGTEEGRTVPLLLRTPNESYAAEVYRHIDDLLQE